MKKLTLILAAAGVIALCAGCNQKGADNAAKAETAATETTAQAGAIVYFDMDRILQEYDMANDLRSVVETKVNSISEELNRRGNKLQNDVQSFQDKINKGLLTQSVAQQQNQKLQEQQNNYQNYYAQKQQEMAEEQQVMSNQIADAIKTFVDEYNAEKKYAMIIATQGDILQVPVVTGAPELDITDELLEGLNAAYVKTKNAGADTTSTKK